MAVAKSQIGELLGVLLRHVPSERVIHLLHDLRKTQAYARNASLRETIDRLHERALNGKED